MAVVSGMFCNAINLALTAGTNAPTWTTTGANGVFTGLSTTGPDDTNNYESATTAAITYGASATNGPGTELVTGHGYTPGGQALTGQALTTVTGANTGLKYTSTAPVWTATDATGIAAVTYIFFYLNFAAGSKFMMFALSLGGTFSATGNTATFTVTPSASGLATFKLK